MKREKYMHKAITFTIPSFHSIHKSCSSVLCGNHEVMIEGNVASSVFIYVWEPYQSHCVYVITKPVQFITVLTRTITQFSSIRTFLSTLMRRSRYVNDRLQSPLTSNNIYLWMSFGLTTFLSEHWKRKSCVCSGNSDDNVAVWKYPRAHENYQYIG